MFEHNAAYIYYLCPGNSAKGLKFFALVMKKYEFKPNRSFQERCEIVKNNPITEEMSYEERLDAQKARFGL